VARAWFAASHLGGSLQALIAEPGCTHITSIDPRPLVHPDERPEIGYRWEHADNSTLRMPGAHATAARAQRRLG
jgi:hypothetical protein